jgi:hypothetical protein
MIYVSDVGMSGFHPFDLYRMAYSVVAPNKAAAMRKRQEARREARREDRLAAAESSWLPEDPQEQLADLAAYQQAQQLTAPPPSPQGPAPGPPIALYALLGAGALGAVYFATRK